MPNSLTIGRAPVLTLWAAVVAQCLGFTWDEALTLGRAVAGLNAYKSGGHLGLFRPTPETERERRRKARAGETLQVYLLHRAVEAVQRPDGVRATNKERIISPDNVDQYLRGRFGESFDVAHRAMADLAKSLPPDVLADRAYALYERFRPATPVGVDGRGMSGTLDLDLLGELARQQLVKPIYTNTSIRGPLDNSRVLAALGARKAET